MKKKKIIESTIIAGLIVNILLPGLGTIIFGNNETGLIQLILSLIGIILMCTAIGSIVGFLLWASMWIWALVFGVKTLCDSKK